MGSGQGLEPACSLQGHAEQGLLRPDFPTRCPDFRALVPPRNSPSQTVQLALWTRTARRCAAEGGLWSRMSVHVYAKLEG